jgi:MOB kinase activator 1
MSGFISTMFVSSPPDSHRAFPLKPKPLLPIFTFAESQSCMNLKMDLDVLEYQEWGIPSNICCQSDYPGGEVKPTKLQETDQTPMQRIEEALRTQQQAHAAAEPNAPASTPRSSPRASSKTNSPARNCPKYCYKLVPGGGAPMPEMDVQGNTALSFGKDSSDTGSITGPATRAHAQSPHSRGYFAGTSLLSLFSNPRTTRAPFKPQKSNRGTSSWQLKQYAEATLGSGSLRKAVKLPEGEDKDEWLAVNGKRCLRRRRELC